MCDTEPVDPSLLNTPLAKRANPVNPDAPAVTRCGHSGAFHSEDAGERTCLELQMALLYHHSHREAALTSA